MLMFLISDLIKCVAQTILTGVFTLSFKQNISVYRFLLYVFFVRISFLFSWVYFFNFSGLCFSVHMPVIKIDNEQA